MILIYLSAKKIQKRASTSPGVEHSKHNTGLRMRLHGRLNGVYYFSQIDRFLVT